MEQRRITVTERDEIQWPSLILAYGPVTLMLVGAVASLFAAGEIRSALVRLTILWSAAILAFLAGVRRGLSFRTEGGPAPAQMATMFLFFVLAFAASAALLLDRPSVAVGLLLLGYLAAAVADPIAAKAGQAPLFFAKLRPGQMALGAAAMAS